MVDWGLCGAARVLEMAPSDLYEAAKARERIPTQGWRNWLRLGSICACVLIGYYGVFVVEFRGFTDQGREHVFSGVRHGTRCRSLRAARI